MPKTFIKRVVDYASLVKFSHSIFAMPFALVGFTYAYTSTNLAFEWPLLLKIIVCMILARNAAMAFNRYIDRKIDAQNARTRGREIPSGVISVRGAKMFYFANVIFFMCLAAGINRLCLYLSPVAMFIVLGYSYAKRFTATCHLILGLGLAIAPMGAYIAVTGQFAFVPALIALLVLSWVAGFDIIYSLQDAQFDRSLSLRSIPARFGIEGALRISSALHVLTVAMVIIVGRALGGGIIYTVGAITFAVLMVYQHSIVKANDLSRVTMAFGTVNGIASVIYGAFTIASLLLE